MAIFDSALEQFVTVWSDLTTGQRALFVVAGFGVVAALIALIVLYGAGDYAVLYGNLEREDAAEIVETLQTDNIPFELDNSGRTVLVPSDRVHRVRLSLASQGIPSGGGVGYEIFDESSFGMSNFAQRMKHLRALEGELTRTVRKMEGVEAARVHLVLPEKKIFEEGADPASASVVLKLKGDKRLKRSQIEGVVYLVASSVEGLDPDNVTVVDTTGAVLYKHADEPVGEMTSTHFEFRRAFEQDLERNVRGMLDKVLGSGAAVVRVAARFNFDRIEETSEIFDPDAVAVRSEERQTEITKGSTTVGGVPGVASNVGDADATETAVTGPATEREAETINYEVSKRVTHVMKTPGVLERLSVAVVVDGNYESDPAAAAQDGQTTNGFVPRTADEIASIRNLVEKAVGYDAARGDEIEVTSIPFKPAEVLPIEEVISDRELYTMVVKYGALVVISTLVLLFVLRPLMKALTGPPVPMEVGAPISIADLERQMEEPLSAEGAAGREFRLDETTPEETLKRETLKKRVMELVTEEPEVSANLVKSWINEEH